MPTPPDPPPLVLESGDPLAIRVTAAIEGGDVPGLRRLLDAHPGLAAGRVVKRGAGAGGRSLLHLATDWPGHRPATAQVIRTLVEAGADPMARFAGAHAETPTCTRRPHSDSWTASPSSSRPDPCRRTNSPPPSGPPATEVNCPPPGTSCPNGWTSTGSGTGPRPRSISP
nr:hypothetical protein [Streptomyces sp. 2132.2]